MCDYCEATIDAGEPVGRVNEGRYINLHKFFVIGRRAARCGNSGLSLITTGA